MRRIIIYEGDAVNAYRAAGEGRSPTRADAADFGYAFGFRAMQTWQR